MDTKGIVNLKLENLYENDIYQIQLDKNIALIYLTFLTHPNPDQFRNAYRVAIDTALRKEVKYWLTDAQQIKSMQPENQSWLKENMAPLLKQLRKFAIVMAPECFVMTNPNQVYSKVNKETESPTVGIIKVHFDKEAAYNWLFSEA